MTQTEILDSLKLPQDSIVVETVSGCGNTSGTGNHTELYVAVLVNTALPANEWNEYFPDAHNVSSDGLKTRSMDYVGVSFSETNSQEVYYIIEYSKSAPFAFFDLRGH